MSGFRSFNIGEARNDLYLLVRLQLVVDDLCPLIDAQEILGIIELDEGDISMNTMWLRFETASTDERNNMVREERLGSPGARHIMKIHRLLSETQEQKLPQEIIFDKFLLKHFCPGESRKKLEIAIYWGRFDELIGYGAPTGTLFLDT